MENKTSRYDKYKTYPAWIETVRVAKLLGLHYIENKKGIVISLIEIGDVDIYPRKNFIRIEMKWCLEDYYNKVSKNLYTIDPELNDIENRINPTPIVSTEQIEAFLNELNSIVNGITKTPSSDSSSTLGSPEWFYEKAQNESRRKFQDWIENKRKDFLNRFSPDRLREMSGKELLEKVFANTPDSMVHQLMFDDDYRNFGAGGKFAYHGIIYYLEDKSIWVYRLGSEVQEIDEIIAAERAEKVRDDLLYIIDCIDKIGTFKSINDYVSLEYKISKIEFYKHSWILKYYQMLYPQYFPGMYADTTLNRALKILGLPSHGPSNKILNAAEISLFIRKCNVNNIIFNDIYGETWGWDTEQKPCPSAADNYKNCKGIVKTVNTSFYQIPETVQEKIQRRIREADQIDKEVKGLRLEGKERAALVKVRVNQGEFRDLLLKRYTKCCLCGVSSPAFLVASHIKPWSECEPSERLDPDNGLLLCPNHDKLFDSGYISFDNKGSIIISEEVNQKDQVYLNIHDDMSIPIREGNIKYMEYHRTHILKYKNI